jgi:hypothetical protein
VDGTCTSLEEPGCVRDADCTGEMVCVDGTCTSLEEPGCVRNADCTGGTVCVDGTCTSLEEPGCVRNADCTGEMVCVDGTCTSLGEPGCVRNADCTGGTVCVDGTCQEPEPPTAGACETAFAWGGDEVAACFIGSDIVDTSRWGWINGPLAPGSYVFDLYAGAAKCDMERGARAGTVAFTYDGANAVTTYQTTAGFVLAETHLHVGTEPLPRDLRGDYTVAPGQYPHAHDLTAATGDTFTTTGLMGPVYVVAHAVTCQVGLPTRER